MPTVPNDGRPQFSLTDISVANAKLGRMPLTGFEQVGPDAFVVAGSYPAPTPADPWSSPARLNPSPPDRPKTPGQALWPNLPTGGVR
jgi:hypothetical protein